MDLLKKNEMKKIVLVLLVFLVCCDIKQGPIKVYEMEVTYFNGQKDTLKLSGYGDNLFSINEGDLQHLRGVSGNHQILASGIRMFKVFSIRLPYDSTEIPHTITLK